MITLPETTIILLNAVMKCGTVRTVHILPERIVYIPANTRCTSSNIMEAGIGDLVQRFVTHSLTKSVSEHFRQGAYSLRGGKIEVLK